MISLKTKIANTFALAADYHTMRFGACFANTMSWPYGDDDPSCDLVNKVFSYFYKEDAALWGAENTHCDFGEQHHPQYWWGKPLEGLSLCVWIRQAKERQFALNLAASVLYSMSNREFDSILKEIKTNESR